MAIQKPPPPSDVATEESTPLALPRRKKNGIPITVWVILCIGVLIVVLVSMFSNTAMIQFVLRKMDNRYTVNDYNQIKMHMSENQVIAILGEPGEMREGGRGRSCDRYLVWKSGRNEIVLGFKKGEVTHKEGTFSSLTGKQTGSGETIITFDP